MLRDLDPLLRCRRRSRDAGLGVILGVVNDAEGDGDRVEAVDLPLIRGEVLHTGADLIGNLEVSRDIIQRSELLGLRQAREKLGGRLHDVGGDTACLDLGEDPRRIVGKNNEPLLNPILILRIGEVRKLLPHRVAPPRFVEDPAQEDELGHTLGLGWSLSSGCGGRGHDHLFLDDLRDYLLNCPGGRWSSRGSRLLTGTSREEGCGTCSKARQHGSPTDPPGEIACAHVWYLQVDCKPAFRRGLTHFQVIHSSAKGCERALLPRSPLSPADRSGTASALPPVSACIPSTCNMRQASVYNLIQRCQEVVFGSSRGL